MSRPRDSVPAKPCTAEGAVFEIAVRRPGSPEVVAWIESWDALNEVEPAAFACLATEPEDRAIMATVTATDADWTEDGYPMTEPPYADYIEQLCIEAARACLRLAGESGPGA